MPAEIGGSSEKMPFAGRAARVRSVVPTPKINMVNINTDSIEQLRTVNLVGEKRANAIISRRPFKDIKDANEKTNIPIKTLKNFYFPNRRTLHTISRFLPRFK